ncbi:unnamed protein product [Lactuca virosa]|nr:unnamed protein product [Lactuca virosa]
MRVLAKRFTVVLILFFIISASTTAEMESPAIQSNNLAPSLSVHSSNKMCSLYSIFFENCLPQLASVYFVFSIVYLWFLVYWTLVCFEVTAKFRRIHLLMAGLILTKALNLIYEAANVTVLIDLIACGAIIIPLTSSIVSMNTGGMRDKSFQKLDVLRNFYAIVMLYFVFMTLVGPARKNGRTGLNAIDAQE